MRRYFLSLAFLLIASFSLAEDCRITGPNPLPVSITGCTFSGSLPSNSTSYIQNTLSPTTTTQAYSVQFASITDRLTVTGQSVCLQNGTGCPSAGAGDVLKASTQTFTGLNTFLNMVTISTTIAGVTRIQWADGTVQVSSPTVSSGGGGGGGGSSSLAITTGSASAYSPPPISSPTAVISFDQSQFSAKLLSATTAFISIAYSTISKTGSYTATSTDTVIVANCASACTLTLPTAAAISGKVYRVKMIGVGPVSIATTSSQTIDGSTTITPNPNQWVNIEVLSDGSNWSIL